jgi:hypothetical protein
VGSMGLDVRLGRPRAVAGARPTAVRGASAPLPRILSIPPWVRAVLHLNPLRELGRYRITIPSRDGIPGPPMVRWAWFR